MKNKNIVFEDDQFEFLSSMKGQASELIRKLLKSHIEMIKPRTKEELLKERAKIVARIEYKKKLEEIERGGISPTATDR